MFKFLKDIATAFTNGLHNGLAAQAAPAASISDFLNTPNNPQWTEQEILQWIASMDKHDQDIIRDATIKAKAEGKDPHKFLCDVRASYEKRNGYYGHGGSGIPGGLLEQVQFTTVIADQFWHNLLGTSYGMNSGYCYGNGGDGVSSGSKNDKG